MKKLTLILLSLLFIILTACSAATPEAAETKTETQNTEPQTAQAQTEQSSETISGGMMDMGSDSEMMSFSQATVPQEYASLTNPVTANDESSARGAEIYSAQCASCHGDGGMGDGPASADLDPPPAAIAHSSHMLGDDYLFWRISEGGAMAPFNSAMPAWKATLDEQARWDVINYVRALNSGQMAPQHVMGGAVFDPEAEVAQRTEILRQAVEQNILTQKEANTFSQVHTLVDNLMAESGLPETGGSMAQIRESLIAELVKSNKITQAQADDYNAIHNQLSELGLIQ